MSGFSNEESADIVDSEGVGLSYKIPHELNLEYGSNEIKSKFHEKKNVSSSSQSKRPSGSSISKSDLKINSRKSRSEANSDKNEFISLNEDLLSSGGTEIQDVSMYNFMLSYI